MAIQQVGTAVTAAGLNLPGQTAPTGVVTAQATVQAPQKTAEPQQKPASSLEQVQQAMKQVAEAVQAKASNLVFSIDKDTGTTVVKVVDAETQTVIRQIPSEEMIDIAKAIEKLQGLLVQQKA